MIIVTGGSSGLGKYVTDHLNGQNLATLTLGRSCNDNFAGLGKSLTCDVSDISNLRRVAKCVKERNYQIDGLINCAGVASMNLTAMMPDETVRKLLDVNLYGTIACCQRFLPFLIRNKRGHIINFSTIAVPLGLAGEAVYVASKSGVEAFSKVFAKEVANYNISVNCIAPGPIETSLIAGVPKDKIKNIVERQIIRKQYTPSDVCKLVDLILDDKASALTGHVFNLGGV